MGRVPVSDLLLERTTYRLPRHPLVWILARHRQQAIAGLVVVSGASLLLTVVVGGLLSTRGYLQLTLLGQYLLVRLQNYHWLMVALGGIPEWPGRPGHRLVGRAAQSSDDWGILGHRLAQQTHPDFLGASGSDFGVAGRGDREYGRGCPVGDKREAMGCRVRPGSLGECRAMRHPCCRGFAMASLCSRPLLSSRGVEKV